MLKRAKDLIPGGKAAGRPDSDFDAKQIAKGTKVETEHVNSKEKAKEISKDHLAEIPDYYTRLAKMEAAATKEGNMMVKSKKEKKNPDLKSKILITTNQPDKVSVSPVKTSSLRRAEILSLLFRESFSLSKEGKLAPFAKAKTKKRKSR